MALEPPGETTAARTPVAPESRIDVMKPQVAIVACSGPPRAGAAKEVSQALERAGYLSDSRPLEHLARSEPRNRWEPQARAALVNQAFANPSIAAILDISGGDHAHDVLPYLDWETIRSHPKLFMGYSDISCVLGALPFPSVLWDPKLGIERGFSYLDRALDGEVLRPVSTGSLPASAAWVGGNIRCFLKLAGTQWWPNITGKVLVLEGLGTTLESLENLLARHDRLGSFARAAALVTGQFTDIDSRGERHEALTLIREYAGALPMYDIPTIGHSKDCEAITLAGS